MKLKLKNESEEQTFQSCKRHLQYKIKDKCDDIKVNDPGRLLYCKDRAYLTCCFRSLHSVAEEYKKNTKYKTTIKRKKIFASNSTFQIESVKKQITQSSY